MRSRASGAARLDASFAGFATRSCAIGAEALARQLNEVFAFLGRAMSDRAGARPYQSQKHRLTKSANPGLLRRDAVYTHA
jgi:class 3 adenylate cyclase